MAMKAPFSCFRHQGPSRRHRAWPCHVRPDTAPGTPESSRGKQLKKALTLSTAISFASLFDVSPARAHGMHCNTQWVPRRHYRGLKEERRPPKFKVQLASNVACSLFSSVQYKCLVPAEQLTFRRLNCRGSTSMRKRKLALV